MCAKCEELQKQIDELKTLMSRGFGQLAKASDPAVQQAALQVTRTINPSKRTNN